MWVITLMYFITRSLQFGYEKWLMHSLSQELNANLKVHCNEYIWIFVSYLSHLLRLYSTLPLTSIRNIYPQAKQLLDVHKCLFVWRIDVFSSASHYPTVAVSDGANTSSHEGREAECTLDGSITDRDDLSRSHHGHVRLSNCLHCMCLDCGREGYPEEIHERHREKHWTQTIQPSLTLAVWHWPIWTLQSVSSY